MMWVPAPNSALSRFSISVAWVCDSLNEMFPGSRIAQYSRHELHDQKQHVDNASGQRYLIYPLVSGLHLIIYHLPFTMCHFSFRMIILQQS